MTEQLGKGNAQLCKVLLYSVVVGYQRRFRLDRLQVVRIRECPRTGSLLDLLLGHLQDPLADPGASALDTARTRALQQLRLGHRSLLNLLWYGKMYGRLSSMLFVDSVLQLYSYVKFRLLSKLINPNIKIE